MSIEKSAVKSASRKGDNIFDKYFAFLEMIKMHQAKERPVDYSPLGNVLTILDRNIVDLHQLKLNEESLRIALDLIVIKTLQDWFPILEYLYKDGKFVAYLAYNLLGLCYIFDIRDSSFITNKSSFFGPSIDYDKLLLEDLTGTRTASYKRSVTLAIMASKDKNNFVPYTELGEGFETINFKIKDRYEMKAFGFHDELLVGDIDIEQLRSNVKGMNLKDLINKYENSLYKRAVSQWDVVITTPDHRPKATTFFNMLFCLSKAIELINDEDINIELVSWGNGSKWAKLVIQFKSLWAKEETQDVLRKSKQALDAELFGKRISEVQKNEAEISKIHKEIDNLPEKELAKESNALDIERKKLELLEKQVDIENKLLEGQLKRIDIATKLSNMIKEGLMQNDSDIQVEINNLLFINKSTGKQLTYDIDSISERESVQPKPDQLDTPTQQG
ncbi:hypothetical protein SAMN05428975_5118 [Mucilaginibacter sp. OK268]|uniref:hypothetical protein n=1 Tax=Mucilaginibacter sp. OK268 TaxID=1881048 RepID=UPI000889ED6C|nr:hypothetical protein [Mucilaginibacter sp. OK268]SDP99687.1 hypothetical protein SAMN05428975_5118 [Mucilaginibacter sp. OK268]